MLGYGNHKQLHLLPSWLMELGISYGIVSMTNDPASQEMPLVMKNAAKH